MVFTALNRGRYHFGNGNGTFQAGISYLTGAETTTLEACDVNNDGVLDIVAASRGEAKINVLLGNGNGTFKAKISSTAVALSTTLTTADFNGDGFVDVISSSWSPTNLYLAFGNGDGTFKEAISMTRSVWVTDIIAVDLNLDGAIDIVTADYGEVNGTTVSVALNRGDGSFSDPISFTTITTPYVLAAGDINNDGYSDIVVGGTSSNRVGVMLNNGQGNFSLSTTFSGVCYGIDVGDLNGDGALDIATAANDNYVSLAKTGLSTLMPYLNLLTQDEAQTAISLLGSQREYVEQELAVVGALQSRLQIIMENLSSQASNYEAAYSRIVDIDVAEEISKLVRNQVLQKSITSILAQANQQSSLVLSLLKQELG
jgi:flagellin-like hook-associated protein FlgL